MKHFCLNVPKTICIFVLTHTHTRRIKMANKVANDSGSNKLFNLIIYIQNYINSNYFKTHNKNCTEKNKIASIIKKKMAFEKLTINQQSGYK